MPVPKLTPPSRAGAYNERHPVHGFADKPMHSHQLPPSDIPPQMDPHPRIPTPDATSPSIMPGADAALGIDAENARKALAQADELGISDLDELAVNEVGGDLAVDEMVRDLELDDIDSFDITSDTPECIAASEDDFALVGVRNLEWRLAIIRTAAHRSAEVIALAQLAEPSLEKEQRLSSIVLSTYRLIDPRFRGSYFQQVRVGRLMPMLLQVAACIDFTSPSVAHKIRQRKNGSRYVRLFGHAIPVTATPSQTNANGSHREQVRKNKPKRTKPKRDQNALNHRDEAREVYEELRSNPYRATWHRWVHDPRFLTALIMLTAASSVGVGLFAARHRLIGPRANAASVTPIPDTAANENTFKPPLNEFLSDPSNDPISSPPGDEIGLVMPAPDVLPTELSGSEMTTDELFQALANVVNVVEMDAEINELPASDMTVPDMTVPDMPASDITVPEMVPDTAPSAEISTTLPVEIKPVEALPTEPSKPTANLPQHDRDAIAEVVSELWSETESAARRFTGSTVAELIDAWDVIAELADPGSIENIAAKRLINEASWLSQPLSEIVAQIRQTDPAASARFAIPADSKSRDTASLTADEITQLLETWQAARKRVVHTVELDRMLHQANVLLDRIVISDQLSPDKRLDFLAMFRNDVEQLSKISKDKKTLAETDELLTAIDTLPAAAAWSRLTEATKPSGLLASVYCLQQRRWNIGLRYLGQTSNLPVASAAKAEWELLHLESSPEPQLEKPGDAPEASDLSAANATLADRWTKIADRLKGREAHTIRLHALELYGDAPEYADQRLKLREQLPAYFEPNAK